MSKILMQQHKLNVKYDALTVSETNNALQEL
jgi:hypothetical protein